MCLPPHLEPPSWPADLCQQVILLPLFFPDIIITPYVVLFSYIGGFLFIVRFYWFSAHTKNGFLCFLMIPGFKRDELLADLHLVA